MTRFSDIVRGLNPLNGVTVDEDGTPFDWAASLAFQQQYSLQYQTLANGARSLSARATGIAGGGVPFYFGFNVQPGRRVILFNRALNLSEGEFNVDVVRAENGFTGGTEGVSQLLSDTGDPSTVNARLFAGVTPDGAITDLEYAYQDTGDGQGSHSAPGVVVPGGVIKAYTEDALLRITKLNTGTFTANLSVVLWEEDA